jgi:cyclic pyranopterin phosphate synthase
MFDSSGREIRYLRVSVTDRCNLRCVYCMPAEGVTLLRHEDVISFEKIRLVAAAAARLGFTKLRLTGGEPLARKGLPDLVAMLSTVEGIATLAMTTNGSLLAPVAGLLRRNGLDSVNVSLDTLDPARYARLTRGGRLEDAVAGIDAALEAGLPVKLNVVALEDSGEEEIEGLKAWAARRGAAVQLIARYHLDEEKRDGGAYDRPPKCSGCDRLRLLADGSLRPCLHGDISIPVDWSDIEGSLARAVLAKPERGHVCTDLEVGQIGG